MKELALQVLTARIEDQIRLGAQIGHVSNSASHPVNMATATSRSLPRLRSNQQRLLNRLDILSRKAEDLGQISAAVRCEELIGKHRGMFIDRQVADVAISNEPSVAEVLRMRRAKRLEAEFPKQHTKETTHATFATYAREGHQRVPQSRTCRPRLRSSGR
jgi:hypothetical protein